ncbi:MAG: hypothetical protein R2706_13790 [Acidimicrobiales bacterium]
MSALILSASIRPWKSGIVRLAAQNVNDLKPIVEQILQPLDFLEKHDALCRSVAVDEGATTGCFGLQNGRHDRQHRGDTRASGQSNVVIGGIGVDFVNKLTDRWQDVDQVAIFELSGSEFGENAVGDPLDTYLEFVAVRTGADRVGPPNVLAIDLAPLNQVLSGLVSKHVSQLDGHVERNSDRVVGFRFDPYRK